MGRVSTSTALRWCFSLLGALTLSLTGCSSVTLPANRVTHDVEVVQNYVADHCNETFRQPNGLLRHPYLVPSGPYQQCWDWDSVFTGAALERIREPTLVRIVSLGGVRVRCAQVCPLEMPPRLTSSCQPHS